MFNSAFAYSKESDLFGAVKQISFVSQTVTLVDNEYKDTEVPLEGILFLEEIGELNGYAVYNHDVLKLDDDSKFWEIEKLENGNFVFHSLDKETFSRTKTNKEFPSSELKDFENVLFVAGNIYELAVEVKEEEEAKLLDENALVIREVNNGEVTYFYGLNNKEKEEIDLIPALTILLNEKYHRTTLSYKVFEDSLEANTFKVVDPMELVNYVTGLTYEVSEDTHIEFKEVDASNYVGTIGVKGLDLTTEQEDKSVCEGTPCEACVEEEETCKECGKFLSACNGDCELW